MAMALSLPPLQEKTTGFGELVRPCKLGANSAGPLRRLVSGMVISVP
jgi:hypothetical protein